MTVYWKETIQNTDLSEKTKALYVGQIEKLLQETGKPIEWILAHPDETIRALDETDYSLPTKRNRVSSICSLFKYWGDASGELSPEREKWCAAQKRMNHESMVRILEGNPSTREIINWVPWNKVLRMERFLRKTEFASPKHLLLAMYTHIEPMRSDFGHVAILTAKPEQCDSSMNWVFLSTVPHQSTICLNKYKTHNKYGTFTRILPESLVTILRANLAQHPRKYLFVTTSNMPYTKNNSFTKYANRTLYQIFGKHLSISLLRHSFISAIDYNRSTPGDLVSVSKNMMHSLSMQQMYRRSIPELSISLEGDAQAGDASRPEGVDERKEERREKKKKKTRRRRRRRESPTDPVYEGHGGRVLFV